MIDVNMGLVVFLCAAGAVIAVIARVAARVLSSRLPDAPASFYAKPLLNRTETRLFHRIAARLPGDLRLMAQVSLGEMVRTRDRKRFFTINARRAKIVIVDTELNVRAALTVSGAARGAGNRRGDIARHRALQEAGIPLIDIDRTWTPDQIHRALDDIMGGNAA